VRQKRKSFPPAQAKGLPGESRWAEWVVLVLALIVAAALFGVWDGIVMK
jgi:hypothetical protein